MHLFAPDETTWTHLFSNALLAARCARGASDRIWPQDVSRYGEWRQVVEGPVWGIEGIAPGAVVLAFADTELGTRSTQATFYGLRAQTDLAEAAHAARAEIELAAAVGRLNAGMDTPVLVTGYRNGGALAVLAAHLLWLDGMNPVVMTFGAPAVLSRTSAQAYRPQRVYEFTTEEDFAHWSLPEGEDWARVGTPVLLPRPEYPDIRGLGAFLGWLVGSLGLIGGKSYGIDEYVRILALMAAPVR